MNKIFKVLLVLIILPFSISTMENLDFCKHLDVKSSLEHALQDNLPYITINNIEYNIVNQSFVSLREGKRDYLDEADALRWLKREEDLNVNLIHDLRESQTISYIRITNKDKELEIVVIPRK